MQVRTDTGDGLPLRGWQRRALVKYLAPQPRDFLAVATPGSGKTTFALRVAAELLGQRAVEQITVVVPTEHLKVQWALAAGRHGLALDPRFSNTSPQTSPEYHGVLVTYAQVAAHPTLHRVRTEQRRTLVVFDEIHHGGDAKTWGEAIRDAFSDATRRLALTGTPFRSDDNPIPFVTYTSGADSVLRSEADHTYGYAEALADGVVRPVVFLAYSGQARWRDSAGEEHAARLGEPLSAEQTARAWRTALDPAGEWMPAVIAAADERLRQKRTHVPDAGGMIIASDRAAARAYAALLTRMTSEAPTVVLSDDPGSSARISQFAESSGRWLVAVRMVSEGVDVPRLAVGIYATSASTPLFFAQAIGRFVRSRRPGETASVFVPSVPSLLQLASELEAQRNHVLGQPHRDAGDPLDADPAVRTQTERSETDTGLHLPGSRRRTGSGHLRWIVVRHRRPGRKRRGGGLPRHPRPARCRPDAGPAAPTPGRATQETGITWRPGPGCPASPILHARPASRSAPRAQHPRLGDPPPHRQTTRLDSQRTSSPLRRPPDRRRDPRPAASAHRSLAAAELRAVSMMFDQSRRNNADRWVSKSPVTQPLPT